MTIFQIIVTSVFDSFIFDETTDNYEALYIRRQAELEFPGSVATIQKRVA
jgi:hypothetical protein